MPVQMMMHRAQPSQGAQRGSGQVAREANGLRVGGHMGLNSEANVRAGW